MNTGTNWEIYVSLALLGLAYEFLLRALRRQSYFKHLGITMLSVPPVALAVLAAAYLIGWEHLQTIAGTLMAIGTPLVLGTYFRDVEQRDRVERELREVNREVANGNAGED